MGAGARNQLLLLGHRAGRGTTALLVDLGSPPVSESGRSRGLPCGPRRWMPRLAWSATTLTFRSCLGLAASMMEGSGGGPDILVCLNRHCMARGRGEPGC